MGISGDIFLFYENFIEELKEEIKEKFLFLHGSAVSIKDKTLIFLGKSGSGKSRIARNLIKKGGEFLGDDPILMKNGEIVPFLKPILLRYKYKGKTMKKFFIPKKLGKPKKTYIFLLADEKTKKIKKLDEDDGIIELLKHIQNEKIEELKFKKSYFFKTKPFFKIRKPEKLIEQIEKTIEKEKQKTKKLKNKNKKQKIQ